MAINDQNRARKTYGAFRAAPRPAGDGMCKCKPSDVGLPDVIFVAGAVPAEDGTGLRVERRLRQSDIDPDFAIASFSKTGPNGGTLLYRRGDTLSGASASATYISPPPDSASIANSYGGSSDGGDINGGAWTINSPYTSATMAGSVKRNGSDAGSDPTWTATLSANGGGFVRTASFTAQWTSDVYWGSNNNTSLAGDEIYDSGLRLGFFDSLQGNRNQTRTITPTGTQYIYFAWPSQAQYTSGTPSFKDSNGFTFPMTYANSTTITRNGVTRTYDIWRSSNLINTTFTITVT